MNRNFAEVGRKNFVALCYRIEDLYFPPSNKLHALQGFSPTRYAIWIDNRWRISFEWSGDRADEVLFEDYHR